MMRWSNVRLNTLSGGLLVSLLLHGLIVAVLLFDLPEPIAEAEPEEEVVAVTIVPPPEPEPAPPPESEPEEPAPEPEAEAPAEPEPEPEQAEETPPVPAGPDSEGEGGAVPIQVIRPVFQFGEEDAGPEIALDGGAAQAPEQDQPEAQPEVTEVAPEPELEPETAAEVPPETEVPAEEAAEELAETPVEQPAQQDAPAPAMPAEITPPDEVLAGDAPGNLPDGADQAELALLPEDPVDPPPPVVPEPVVPDPVEIPPPASTTRAPSAAPADTAPAVDNGLPGVRALSSIVDTGHAVATTAMGALPREERGSRLCTTELREQLRRAPEPYRVELLPAYRLPGGTVLAVPNAAFRAGGAWYNLSFRCTVDRDALRVTDFSFKVGTPIPRQDWRARGFPEF
jgi:outer membrane biosynthesis protein TonB